MRIVRVSVAWLLLLTASAAVAQPLGEPDRGEPGDAMIQNYLRAEAAKIESRFDESIGTAAEWRSGREQAEQEYLEMLGLWPLPERTPLEATVTHTISGQGYVIDTLHYQSRPKLYVTANLYRPSVAKPGEKLPAILYVCGHAGQGRNGNKTYFQSQGMWLARHGYVCLIVDTLQWGEINASHHGTYNLDRWWWHSRGYASAGVECWNGVRGIDYLVSRADVDAERIGVTGISGGGAATFWIAAADSRVKVAVPVSGMSDLESYVSNRVINGHCDCMFLHNEFAWPWTKIAALVAPRPLLFANSSNDSIFPMDGNRRISRRLGQVYGLLDASDKFASLVSGGGHDYRQDIREGTFRFLNKYLKDDDAPVTDTEVDLVTTSGGKTVFPIPPERLRAFATDAELPRDQINTRIDEILVPIAEVKAPTASEFPVWKKQLLARLRRVPFRCLPTDGVPAARPMGEPAAGVQRLASEDGIQITTRVLDGSKLADAKRVVLLIDDDEPGSVEAMRQVASAEDAVIVCQPRGIGPTRWTKKNPPNYVARSCVLLGRTVDAGRVWDIAATARYLKDQAGGRTTLALVARGHGAALAAYAALEGNADEVVLLAPTLTHMNPKAPQFLGVLRVCDIVDALGLLAPRRLTIIGSKPDELAKVKAIFAAAGAADALAIKN